MTKTETLIIGQGLCGTWLSWWLHREGADFLLMDDGRPMSASRIASGVINPVTGRAIAETWMADRLLPFALEAYTALGKDLGLSCIRTVDVLHSFPTAQMRDAFYKRLPQLPQYLKELTHTEQWQAILESPFGMGSIAPVLLIDLHYMLEQWQKKLQAYNRYIPAKFDYSLLRKDDGKIQYGDIRAERIIFCDGIGSLYQSFFNRLPLVANKGEALLLKVEGLSPDHIYKKGISLVPYPHAAQRSGDQYFWAGSTYENNFTEEGPTAAFRNRTEQLLKDWLKLPFTVEEHWAAVRPATIERRPFAGFHPLYPQIGLVNGTGTKGCSLAPWLGRQMTDLLLHGKAVAPEAGLARYAGVLSAG